MYIYVCTQECPTKCLSYFQYRNHSYAFKTQFFKLLHFSRTGQTYHFYRATACNAAHGIAIAILSVRPSVCQMRVL